MHVPFTQSLGPAFVGTLPLASLSAGSFIQAQVFSKHAGSLPVAATGTGNVTAAANIADNSIVRGDGGTTGVQQSNCYIDDNDNVIIGNTSRIGMGVSQTPQFQVIGNTTSLTSDNGWIGQIGYNTTGVGAGWFSALSKTSTIGNQTAVALNDILGFFTFRGSDGTQFLDGGGLQVQVSGSVASNQLPTRLTFYTNNSTSTPTQCGNFSSTGNLLLQAGNTEVAAAGRCQIGTIASTTAADGLLLGGDVQMFRRAANLGRIPDQLEITGAFATAPIADGVSIGSGVIAQSDFTRTANNRNVFSQFTGGTYSLSFANDAFGATLAFMQVVGGQAAGVTSVTFPNGNVVITNNLTINGNTTIGNANTDTLTVAPNAVTWSNNPTHSGNHVFSGNVSINGNSTLGDAAGDTVTVTGTPAGQVIGSTYTPTASTTTNLDATPTMQQAQYMRVGATVTVSGTFTADPTAAGAASFEFTLPVASNIGATEDVAGVAFSGAIAGQGAAITGSVANDRAVVSWTAVDVTNQAWSFTMTYQII